MVTIKQKKAFKTVMDRVENGSTMKDALVKAGYSKNTAKAPTKITKSSGWLELLEKHIPDKKLTKVLEQGLDATDKELPDYAVRHKYLETGLKLKSKFPQEKLNPEDAEGLKGLIVVVNNIINGG